MSLLDNLPHTARIERDSYSRESNDVGNLATRVTITASIDCWVQNASSGEIAEYDKRDQRVTHKVYFCEDPGLRIADYIVVTAGDGHVGEELKHLGYSDRSAGLGLLFRSMCELETNPRPTSFS